MIASGNANITRSRFFDGHSLLVRSFMRKERSSGGVLCSLFAHTCGRENSDAPAAAP